MGGGTPLIPSLSSSFRLPLPFPPSHSLPLPIFLSPFPKFQLGDLYMEHCKLPQRGLERSPSRNRIWCIFASKYDIRIVTTIFNNIAENEVTKFRAVFHLAESDLDMD